MSSHTLCGNLPCLSGSVLVVVSVVVDRESIRLQTPFVMRSNIKLRKRNKSNVRHTFFLWHARACVQSWWSMGCMDVRGILEHPELQSTCTRFWRIYVHEEGRCWIPVVVIEVVVVVVVVSIGLLNYK